MQKVAVVTGSAKGLGRAIALALASFGYILVVHYHTSQQEAKKVLGQIRVKAPKSIMIKADLKSEAGVKKMFEEIFKKLGRVDLLVNNVGNFVFKKFGQTSNSEFKDIVESNLYSTLFASRAVLPFMRKQKSGKIINIGAVGAERIQLLEKSTPYFLAKTAVYTITKVMAWEEARNGIHVNMISPASLATDIFSSRDFPMGRSASYDDVVKVLKFLISSEADYVNGANIEVAGAFIPGIV
mgnify:CR=1 FL=1